MIRISGIDLKLDYTEKELKKAAAAKARISQDKIQSLKTVKRAVDARRKNKIKFNFIVDIQVKGNEQEIIRNCASPQVKLIDEIPYLIAPAAIDSCEKMRPVVVGSGPAGLFAALVLAKAGLEPLLLEQGSDVDTRQNAVERFRYSGVLDLRNNVQFGEGGAGTFSDGKLNTGIKDPRCHFVLQQLAEACGDHSLDHILWQAKPHAGTDKLKLAVKGLREKIQSYGGKVCFNSKLTGLLCEDNKEGKKQLCGLTVETPQGTSTVECRQAVLAIGHSARDTVQMLLNSQVAMQQKPFSVGVRIEHPRQMIDQSQYGEAAGHPRLGAADYKLSCRTKSGRGVYTFCMCPGGVVVPAASEEGGVVVNGMSELARNADNSNSAVLVGIEPGDLGSDHPLAGVELQRRMEQAAFRLGGGGYKAPVQLAGDFLQNKPSSRLGDICPSYLPGVTPSDLNQCLPTFAAEALREGIPQLGRYLHGFDRYDAVLTGVESRSTSPVRWLRDENGQSSVGGLYPCGEGAGYAGGIMSAAVDGMRCAQWLIQAVEKE